MNTNILSHEVSLYKRRRREFEEKHRGQWVVIHQDDIGFYDDFQVAAQTAVDRFGRGPYLIRQVGAPVQPLPVSILYRPDYASR